ncbi:MAG: hypothetical protein NT091_05430, partial [Candidatus Falkowbacteria bacterium]|nr:hypothetical protein [Candidatus Falkowbacteria bacterium]
MKKKLILFFSIFGIFSLWNNCLATTQNGSVNVTANIIGCGNNIIENAEECDGTALGGQTCLSRGFFGGTLSCQASCAFNTSSCSTAPPTSSGGGGGWINTVIAALTPTVQIEAKAIFSGRGYSNRKVFLLKDGQFATSTMASADGTFEVSMLNLTYGNYIFGIYGEDIYGNKSILTTLPVSLSGGTTFNYGGIFIAPTITLNKSNIKPGESIQIIGQSTPLAKINIYINTINETILGANTDQGGLYQYTLNTTGLPVDDYLVTARA